MGRGGVDGWVEEEGGWVSRRDGWVWVGEEGRVYLLPYLSLPNLTCRVCVCV